MTRSEKALKVVLQHYMPKKKSVKKVIKESVVKQQIGKIQPEVQVQLKELPQKDVVQLDGNQKEFIQKFIEYNELLILNTSSAELIDKFQKALGVNSKQAIQMLDKKIKQRAEKIQTLSKDLVKLKEDIEKETEKARAKATLISLADGIATPDKKEKAPEHVIINAESKKKKK